MLAEELGEGLKFKVYFSIDKPDDDKTFIIQSTTVGWFHSWVLSNVDIAALATCVLETMTPEQVKNNKGLKTIFDTYKETENEELQHKD